MPAPGRNVGASIAWLPTLLAKGPARLGVEHLRFRSTKVAPPRLHLIVLDTSGSMRQGGRLALAKGFAARLVELAARAGEHVALLSFGGHGVELLVPPAPARAAGAARVRQCGGGGGTPLAQALDVAQGLLNRHIHRNTHRNIHQGLSGGGTSAALWLLTDGRTLEQPPPPRGAVHTVIVDFDDRQRGAGRCADWAAHWGAEHRLPDGTVQRKAMTQGVALT